MNNIDKEAFDKYVKENQSSYFGVPSWEIDTDRKIWLAACNYKQREIDALKLEYDKLTEWAAEYKAENAKLRECVEWYANRKNCDNADFSHVEVDDSGEEIADGGYRAREALKELEEK